MAINKKIADVRIKIMTGANKGKTLVVPGRRLELMTKSGRAAQRQKNSKSINSTKRKGRGMTPTKRSRTA